MALLRLRVYSCRLCRSSSKRPNERIIAPEMPTTEHGSRQNACGQGCSWNWTARMTKSAFNAMEFRAAMFKLADLGLIRFAPEKGHRWTRRGLTGYQNDRNRYFRDYRKALGDEHRQYHREYMRRWRSNRLATASNVGNYKNEKKCIDKRPYSHPPKGV